MTMPDKTKTLGCSKLALLVCAIFCIVLQYVKDPLKADPLGMMWEADLGANCSICHSGLELAVQTEVQLK